jgi:hypothetical protein
MYPVGRRAELTDDRRSSETYIRHNSALGNPKKKCSRLSLSSLFLDLSPLSLPLLAPSLFLFSRYNNLSVCGSVRPNEHSIATPEDTSISINRPTYALNAHRSAPEYNRADTRPQPQSTSTTQTQTRKSTRHLEKRFGHKSHS